MRAARNEFYTAEEYAAAKDTDIAAFLMSIGYGLTRESRCYKGKAHDSLVIRDDGRWYWNSRDLHGYSPIELYKQILLEDYGYSDEITAAIAAVKELAGGRGAYAAPVYMKPEPSPPPRAPDTPLLLPAPYKNNNRVMAYLCGERGLDPVIVRGLMRYGKIYETVQCWDKGKQKYADTPYHNAVFVAYDKGGRPQNAFLRGTLSVTDKPFKRDVDFSDKSYPFTLSGRPSPPPHAAGRAGSPADRVFCFESAIDAISHASIYKMNGEDWRDSQRISLGGTSFLGLDRFLSEHPQIRAVVACLDNDGTGNRRSEKLMEEYAAKGYHTGRDTPAAKDFNEDLLNLKIPESEDDLDYEQ
jgi:hypothetical protein